MTISNASTDLVSRLESLAAVRTARTDQLHARTVELFARLRDLCPVGTNVIAGNVSLTLERRRSNVGSDVCWSVYFENNKETYLTFTCDDIERPVGFKGFLHGDFHCEITGPSRRILIEVGLVAKSIVEKLIEQTEKTNSELEAATAKIDAATAALDAAKL
jgi:hypothetical protein